LYRYLFQKYSNDINSLRGFKENEKPDFKADDKAFKTVNSNYKCIHITLVQLLKKKTELISLKSTLSKANNTISEAENQEMNFFHCFSA